MDCVAFIREVVTEAGRQWTELISENGSVECVKETVEDINAFLDAPRVSGADSILSRVEHPKISVEKTPKTDDEILNDKRY